MENYSLSDIAAVNGQNAGAFGGNGAWVLIILFALIFGNDGFGFGGNNRGYQPQYATQDFVQNGFNFNDLQSQNRDILNAIQQTAYDNGTNIKEAIATLSSTVKDTAYANLTENRDIQAALAAGFAEQQKCCCETLRAIDGVNYNGALNTASINANTTAQTQKILDAINGNRIADMQNQINALQLQNAMCGVVRYPNASTYCAGMNPYGCSCNCGNV